MSTAPTDAPAADPPRRRHLLRWILGLVVLLAALWAGGYAAAGERTPRGTTALGVDIGGKSPDDAAAALRAGAAERSAAPVAVTVAGTATQIEPATSGLGLDAEATVEDSGIRTWNPVSIVSALTGGSDVTPRVEVDEAALDAAVATLAGSTDKPAVEGDVSFEGTEVVTVTPAPGTVLDRPAAAAALREAYLRATGPVALPTRVAEPEVDADEVARAVREFAEPAVSAPVVVAAGEDRVEVPVEEVTASLDMTADASGTLAPVVDGAELAAAVTPRMESLGRTPQDASFEIRGGKPVVVPAVEGLALDPAAMSTAVATALTGAGDSRVATVGTVVTQPKLTTDAAKKLGVVEKISSFTQPFPYAAYRVQNIGRAARYIDGTLLLPGETFSMNEVAKERSVANGYTVGAVISGGRLRQELGGGVSTVTTAMWDAAFFAGLERVEQRAHSFYISRYKAGLEATVVFGALDLKFKNDSPTGVFIQATSDNNSVSITMWGTKRYEVEAVSSPRTNSRAPKVIYDPKPGCVPQSGGSGFDITVTRTFSQGGKIVKREPLRTKYNASDVIYCRAAPGADPPPSSRPSASPSPTPSATAQTD